LERNIAAYSLAVEIENSLTAIAVEIENGFYCSGSRNQKWLLLPLQ